MSGDSPIEGGVLAAQMRQAFDQGFGLPPTPPSAQEALILLRAGETALALKCIQIQAIIRAGVIAPLPRPAPGLLGLSGVRGALIPVFSLAAALGLPTSPVRPGWLALVASETPIALAFEDLEGQVAVTRDCLTPAPADPAHPHLRDLLCLPSTTRAVADIPGLLAALRRQPGLNPSPMFHEGVNPE